MRLGALLILGLTVALAGCGSSSIPAKATAKATPMSSHAGKPYELYTHCGIEWAKIRGTFWRSTRMLSDGNGNPPPGWGNPFQAGTLTFASPSTAKFSSTAGKVTFKRTSRTRPPTTCS